jgi:hypothetical protein
MSTNLQEILALAVVAVAVALMLWRRYRRRAHPGSACNGCDAARNRPSKEKTLHFHRRR